MPLEDYLTPGEQIRFQSSGGVRFGKNRYHVVITDRRILLYARRGFMAVNDEVVTQKTDDLHGIRYSEEGFIGKRGIIHIEGKTKMDLWGPATEIKTIYQQMMAFM